MIDIDDDINLDDIWDEIWDEIDDIWMKLGWYFGEIDDIINDLYVCSYMRVYIYRGYSDSYILMIFGMKLMKFGWYLDEIWVIFGMKLMI